MHRSRRGAVALEDCRQVSAFEMVSHNQFAGLDYTPPDIAASASAWPSSMESLASGRKTIPSSEPRKAQLCSAVSVKGTVQIIMLHWFMGIGR